MTAYDSTSSTADRGKCPVCGGWYLITAKGRVRHHGAKDGSWPPRRCDGAGQYPAPDYALPGPTGAERGAEGDLSKDLQTASEEK